MLWSRIVVVFFVSLLLSACASDDTNKAEFDSLDMVELYNQAQEDIEDGNYNIAVSKLDALIARYPFGSYAESAELSLIYANLMNDTPAASIAVADRFIRLHPDHPQVDYAYYMRGLANYYNGFDLTSRFLPGDAAKRDIGSTRSSFNDFAQLIRLYPNSPYAHDAQARMVHIRNVLARHEIYVAQYYLRRQTYVAALNRAKEVVNHYQETPSVADALSIMTESYYHLGLNDLAETTKSILILNYPNYPTLDENGNFIAPNIEDTQKKSWLETITFGLLG